jgi:hypothetical protein
MWVGIEMVWANSKKRRGAKAALMRTPTEDEPCSVND